MFYLIFSWVIFFSVLDFDHSNTEIKLELFCWSHFSYFLFIFNLKKIKILNILSVKIFTMCRALYPSRVELTFPLWTWIKSRGSKSYVPLFVSTVLCQLRLLSWIESLCFWLGSPLHITTMSQIWFKSSVFRSPWCICKGWNSPCICGQNLGLLLVLGVRSDSYSLLKKCCDIFFLRK